VYDIAEQGITITSSTLLHLYYTTFRALCQYFAGFMKTFSFLCESLRAAAAAVRHGRTPLVSSPSVRKARSPSPKMYCNKKHHKPGGRCQEKFSENVFIPPGGR